MLFQSPVEISAPLSAASLFVSSIKADLKGICLDLLEATYPLATLFGIEPVKEIYNSPAYFKDLLANILSLEEPKFHGHKAIQKKTLQPVRDSLETIDWLLRKISAPDFDPSIVIDGCAESPELLLATARRYISQKILQQQIISIAQQIEEHISAKAEILSSKVIEAPLSLTDYLQSSQLLQRSVQDIDPDDDPTGKLLNSCDQSEQGFAEEFNADMDWAGKEGFSELTAGKITANNSKAFNVLGVKIPAILLGSSGRMIDIFSWVRDTAQFPELQELIFSTELPQEIPYSPRHITYEYPLQYSQNGLPLPAKHEVLAISFIDQNGKLIAPTRSSQKVSWSVFGGLKSNAPAEARSVRYTIKMQDWKISKATFEAFLVATENPEFYSPVSVRSAISVSKELLQDYEERAQFLFRIVQGQQFIASHDQRIAEVINQSGLARNEVIAGLGCGNCTPINYHLASLFRKAGIPSLVLMGDPVMNEGVFLVRPGHSQAFVFSRTAGSTLDLTNNMATQLGTNANKIPEQVWQEYITKIQKGTLREAFVAAREIRELIKCSSEESIIADMQAGFGSLPRFTPIPGGDDARSFNFSARADFRNDPKLDKLAQIYNTKIFVDTFRSLAAKAILSQNFSELYSFCHRQGEFPEIDIYNRRSLPEHLIEYARFNGKDELHKLTTAALNDSKFSATGKSICSNWLLQQTVYERKDIKPAHAIIRKPAHSEQAEANKSEVAKFTKVLPKSVAESVFAFGNSGFIDATIQTCLDTLVSINQLNQVGLGFANFSNKLFCTANRMASVAEAVEILANAVCGNELSGRQINTELEDAILLLAIGVLSESFNIADNNYQERLTFWDEFDGKKPEIPPPFEESRLRSRAAANKIISVYSTRAKEKTLDLALFIAGYGNSNLRECWRWFREYCTTTAKQFQVLFEWETRIATDSNLLTLKLAHNLEKNFRSEYSYQEALPWLKELGLNPDWLYLKEHIKAAFLVAYAEDSSVKFNLPNQNNPYSDILYHFHASTRKTLFDSLTAISNAMTEDPLQFTKELWPVEDEQYVGRFILRKLSVGRLYGDIPQFLFEGRYVLDILTPGEIPVLLSSLAEDNIAVRLACLILKQWDRPYLRLAENFATLKQNLPAEWESFTDRIADVIRHDSYSGSVSNRIQASAAVALMNGMDIWQKYIALLATNRLSASEPLQRLEGEQYYEFAFREKDQNKKQFLDLIESWSKPFFDQQSVKSIFEYDFDWPTEFSRVKEFTEKLSKSELLCALVSAALVHTSEHSHSSTDQIVGRTHNLQLRDSTGILSKGRVRGAWSQTLLPRWTSGATFYDMIAKVRKLADSKLSKGRLLKHRISGLTSVGRASLEVPVQSGGDFSELREMVHGDDLKHVDWKSYGRTDRYYVKKYVDIEPQAGVMIVDIEWLCLGVDSNSFGRSRFSDDENSMQPVPKGVLSLFAELYSLSRDRNYPHLIFCLRGDLIDYHSPEQVKANLSHTLLSEAERKKLDSDCPSYQDEAFLYDLFWKIQRCSAALRTEAEWKPSGFYPTNSLREVPLEILAKLPKRARILTGVHPRNKIPTLKYLRAIASKMGSRVSEL